METVVTILTLAYWPCILCKQGGCLQQPLQLYLQKGSHARSTGTVVDMLSKSCACALVSYKTVLKVEPMCKRKKLTTKSSSSSHFAPKLSEELCQIKPGPRVLTSTCISSFHQIRLLHARVVSELLPALVLFLVYLESHQNTLRCICRFLSRPLLH